MNNVHEDGPVVFQSRWALSYLRGPLSREQIQGLMAERKAARGAKPQASGDAERGTGTSVKHDEGLATGAPPVSIDQARIAASAALPPVLPPEIPEVFLPRRKLVPAGRAVRYQPALVGTARIHFSHAKSGIDAWEALSLLAPLAGTLTPQPWDEASVSKDELELEKERPTEECTFAKLPSDLTRPRRFAGLATALKDHLYCTETRALWNCPPLKQISRLDESEGDFRVRLSQAARQERDARVEKLRAKFAPKLAQIRERLRRAQQKVEKEESQASQAGLQSMLSAGASLLGAFLGRKVVSAANVNRAASAARAGGRASREKHDVTLAEEDVRQYQEQHADLESQFEVEAGAIQDLVNPESLPLEEILIKPKKADISVTLVALAWMPYAVATDGSSEPLY